MLKYIQNNQTVFETKTNFIDLSTQIINELMARFDGNEILKYELSFKPGVLVGQCHKIDDIDPLKIESLVVTIK